jgi:hypothetical protein
MGLQPEFALHHSGFEPFLFAPIWEEKNGSLLSVLSAFARLGVDPWGEAARLAAMPRDKAAAALATMLTRLAPGDLNIPVDPSLTGRLVKLLPAHASILSTRQAGSRRIDLPKAKSGLILGLGAVLVALQASGWLF